MILEQPLVYALALWFGLTLVRELLTQCGLPRRGLPQDPLRLIPIWHLFLSRPKDIQLVAIYRDNEGRILEQRRFDWSQKPGWRGLLFQPRHRELEVLRRHVMMLHASTRPRHRALEMLRRHAIVPQAATRLNFDEEQPEKQSLAYQVIQRWLQRQTAATGSRSCQFELRRGNQPEKPSFRSEWFGV